MMNINFIEQANNKNLVVAYKDLASAESTAKNKYIVFMLTLVHTIKAADSVDNGIKQARDELKEGLGAKKYTARRGDISDKISVAKSLVDLDDESLVKTLQEYNFRLLRQAAKDGKSPEEVKQASQQAESTQASKPASQPAESTQASKPASKPASQPVADSADDDITKEWDSARAAVDKVLDVQPLKLTSAELQALVDDLTKTVQNWSKVIALRVADAERAKAKKAA